MKRSLKSKAHELVSIVIPAYNEERYIDSCINSLFLQSYRNIEIIVVDDGSTDKTREIVKNHSKVRLLQGSHQGPGASRNLGSEKAKGSILIFVDADMTFDKDYIKNLVSPLLEDPNLIGTTHGYEIASNLNNIWSSLWGKVRVDPDDGHEKVLFRAIRKKEFFRLGKFDPKLGYADDQTFWLKYRTKPLLVKSAICYHRNPETLNEIFKQSRWIGSSISNIWTELPVLRLFFPIILFIISPLAIIFLSLRRARKIKSFKSFFPWMTIFMTVRYFGAVNGIMRKIYLGMNVR